MTLRMKSHTLVTLWWFSLRCLTCRFFYQSEFSKPPSSIQVSYFNLSSRRRRRPCLLIPHISAQDGECVARMKKETFPSCLVQPPHTQFFLPLSLSSAPLRRCKSKQTAVQAPQIITQESHWERCVGSGCDSMCAAVFTDIHLHMPRPPANKEKPWTWIWCCFFFLSWGGT